MKRLILKTQTDLRIALLVLVLPAGLLWIGPGCGPSILREYDQAEALARQQDKPLLIFFRDHLDPASGQMMRTLQLGEVASLCQDYVRCDLLYDFEPNQRYMAQFGVTRCPALAVLLPDGTYHTKVGMLGVDQIAAFLENAKHPGKLPRKNVQVPRGVDYDWEGDYVKALERAARQNRDLLIFYKWWVSPESTEMLSRLNRSEVAIKFVDTVNCILDYDYVPNRQYVAQYGARKLPTMIIVHPDGRYKSREGLLSVKEILQFAVSNVRRPAPTSPTPMVARSNYQWYFDYDTARAAARRFDKKLFIFYKSVFSADSNELARLLDLPEVARFFTDTINCRLDWRDPENRKTMTAFSVDRVPALVILRQDGTFHARTGRMTIDQITGLIKAGNRPGHRPEKRQ